MLWLFAANKDVYIMRHASHKSL